MNNPEAFLEDDEWVNYHFLNASPEERDVMDNISGNDEAIKALGAAAVLAIAKGADAVPDPTGLVGFAADKARDKILDQIYPSDNAMVLYQTLSLKRPIET